MLTYNREKLVSRMIECILRQTFRNFEFIIVDNGSTDESGAIADGYALKDNRVRVIRKERGNIGSGRNAGLDVANGEWIAFIDDDDYCEPDFLEFLLKLAIDNDADIAICGATNKEFDEKLVYSAEDAIIELLQRNRFNVQFPTKLIKRELFDKVRFSEASKYDDIELMPRILANANRVAYHGLPKYTFERHGNNNSAWTTDHSRLDHATLDEYLQVYRERTKWLIERFPGSSAAWRYFEWLFGISMVEKIARFGLTDCSNIANRLKRKLAEHREEFLSYEFTQDFEREWVELLV
jgi:glycosyltransferase involved in cell wall biosynthesis